MLSCVTNHRNKFFFYILAAIFWFANLKVKFNKHRMFSVILKFSTHKICKKQVAKKNKIIEQSSMFKFQAWLNTHIFRKGCNILPLKQYMTFINIKKTLIFSTYVHRGLENKDQIWLCPIIKVLFCRFL